jgi:hypothetical protein
VAPPARVEVGFVAPEVPGFGYRIFGVVYGLMAVYKSTFFAGNAVFVFSDLNTWGWITFGLGALAIVSGLAVFSGASGPVDRHHHRRSQRSRATTDRAGVPVVVAHDRGRVSARGVRPRRGGVRDSVRAAPGTGLNNDRDP